MLQLPRCALRQTQSWHREKKSLSAATVTAQAALVTLRAVDTHSYLSFQSDVTIPTRVKPVPFSSLLSPRITTSAP